MKNENFETVSQCRKTGKRGPFGLYETSVCCKLSKHFKEGPFGDKKIFEKKSQSVEKIQRGDPVVPSGFVSYVKIEYTKGDLFALT